MTAVEWLEKELRTKHGIFTHLYKEFEQAKQKEAEQRKELSDEDIKKIASEYVGNDDKSSVYYWVCDGMKLYRELLK